MNRREFIKVFTFGVAAVLPTVAVPEQIPQLGVPFERADGMIVVCFRAAEVIEKGRLIAVDCDHNAYAWTLSGARERPKRRMNGIAVESANKGEIITVISVGSCKITVRDKWTFKDGVNTLFNKRNIEPESNHAIQ